MRRLLQDLVTAQADTRPEADAVVCGSARLTYGELDALSTRLARLLREAGCRQGDRIALLTPKSTMAIVALVGIYKADGIYVPLDPASPSARVKRILDSCGTRWILAGGPVAPLLEEVLQDPRWCDRLSVGWLDEAPREAGIPVSFTRDDLAVYSSERLQYQNGPHNPAHILFTSGSTGVPKGVVITHANVTACVAWAAGYFGLDSTERVSCHPPLHFDMSFLDIFGAASVGAELHLVPPLLNVLPNNLAEFIRASAITQWFSVPSVLSYMAHFDLVGDFPALKRVLWAGDVLPTPTLMHWMTRLPHARFTNLYGPTEATIISTYYTVPACPHDPHDPIPIGTACDGEEVLVLDEALQPVPRGEIGDLYIAGAGLACGYWGDPEQTDAAFVRHPARPSERMYRTGDLARVGDEGLVYFIGRRDSQIKSRGYRIELGEIEAALNTVPCVQESAVVALERGGFEGAVLCCAYVPADGKEASPVILRRALSQLVPSYMLPLHWLAFRPLPTNANGKVDRRRLKQLFQERLDAHAPPTARFA